MKKLIRKHNDHRIAVRCTGVGTTARRQRRIGWMALGGGPAGSLGSTLGSDTIGRTAGHDRRQRRRDQVLPGSTDTVDTRSGQVAADAESSSQSPTVR